jgi:hypothetical protein
VCVWENTFLPPLLPLGGYQPMSFGWKNIKREKRKRGKCKRIRRQKIKGKLKIKGRNKCNRVKIKPKRVHEE